MKRVSGIVELMWTVELPDEFCEAEGNNATDPAIEAVIDFLPQMGKVFFRGEDQAPANVFLEVHEDDFVTEEDERDDYEDEDDDEDDDEDEDDED